MVTQSSKTTKKDSRRSLSNSFSTGGGGVFFEHHVQACYVTLMLTKGDPPCFSGWNIKKIKLQGSVDGFETDDMIVFVENPVGGDYRKILIQIKHSLSVTAKDGKFQEVMTAAWIDFNNGKLFTRDKDAIALITGPLSRTDFDSIKWLTYHARKHSSEDFVKYIRTAKFCKNKTREKYDIIKKCLVKANDGKNVDENAVHSFLKHFYHLGYDLGEREGVVLSLITSHISQYRPQDSHAVWSQVLEYTGTMNHGSGTITADTLPEDISELFTRTSDIEIPKEISTQLSINTQAASWNNQDFSQDLALLSLVGSWNASCESDCSVLEAIVGKPYDRLATTTEVILNSSENQLQMKNTIWKVIDRVELLNVLNTQIFDRHLDSFGEQALSVLRIPNPAFDLPTDKRYASALYGKVLPHSKALRKGIAEGLAILGGNSYLFTNCSINKVENTVNIVVSGIFENSDWRTWGSLNDVMPEVAEASPNMFLESIETALQATHNPFVELFTQESNGITGENYLTGLLWALEALAWDQDFFIRVCLILSNLALIDPGGQYANRPVTSILTILTPWLPQTQASMDKRYIAVKAILNECPTIGWNLLIQLLPGQHQSSHYSNTPNWRNPLPRNHVIPVTNKEYSKEVSLYAQLAVETAGSDIDKIVELIEHFNNLPKPAFDKLLLNLSSDVISGLPEEQLQPIWETLSTLTRRHRRFSDAKWALPEELLIKIDEVKEKLAPSSYEKLYFHLFQGRDNELFESNKDYNEQYRQLEARRSSAIKAIFESGGVEAAMSFAKSVSSQRDAGFALGDIGELAIEKAILPEFLDPHDQKNSELAKGFTWKKFRLEEWGWCDRLDRSNWTISQVGLFLSFLEGNNETWDRVNKWLGADENEYWAKVDLLPYTRNPDIDIAIEKLIKYGRSRAAISCLGGKWQFQESVNEELCIKALNSAIHSKEPSYTMDTFYTVELIKHLQSSKTVLGKDIFKIEWAYLQLLIQSNDAEPVHLEQSMAKEPELFCEVIQLCFRSSKDESAAGSTTSDNEVLATNAWRLLGQWRIVPGASESGEFNTKYFTNWLKSVRTVTKESGHLEIALEKVGEVLIYTPPDSDGLWINRDVAGELNKLNNQNMRNGYRIGKVNSRGVHWVDPEANPEKELAAEYKKKAQEIDDAGFPRFSATLKELSEFYRKHAERIISEHKKS